MICRHFTVKMTKATAVVLATAMCLSLFSIVLAASVPSAPESLTAVPGNGKVALVWFEPEDDGGAAITGYQVSVDGGATWIDVGLATSYTFDGLTGGLLYTFMIRAVNGAGYGEEAIANAKPKDANPDAGATGNQTGQGQVITGGGGGGGGIIVEPPPPPPPPEDDPPVTPPPKKEEPQPEDYIPIEIDPEEVPEWPLGIVKPKIMDLVGTYTIVANGEQAPAFWWSGSPMKADTTLDFRATKIGGNMYGVYTGNGALSEVLDSEYSRTKYNINEFAISGPLSNISLTLFPPPGSNALGPLPPIQPGSNSGSSLTPLPPLQPADSSGSNLKPLPPIQSVGNSGSALTPLPPLQPADNSGSSLTPLPPLQPAENSGSSLTPLPPLQPADSSGSSLTPLPPLQPADNSGSALTPLPPIQPIQPVQATGEGTMYWNWTITQDHNYHIPSNSHFYFQSSGPANPLLHYDIILYEDGTGILTHKAQNCNVYYKVRLVKRVTLVNVK